ncbi:hypothetical protein LMG6871_02876 [Ralstonia edaphis]|nr:hypothetical protein LMG6871_02876 [Ralstonia sp. LMG 6871]
MPEEFKAWAREQGYPFFDLICLHGPTSSMPGTEERFSSIALAGWLACAKHLEEAVKDAERYRAIRVLGREWSNMRVFDYRGALDPQALDEEADALIAATKGENDAE